MTNTTTSGAADLPEALRSIQRFEVVDCIDDKHVPAVIPKTHGPWVRYEDHIAALAAGQATAAQPGVVYAELPEYGINTASHAHFRVLGFTANQMRAFADATHTLRASHGEAPAQTADSQLLQFYGVTTDAELIAAQAAHIEKLQAKLTKTPSFAPQRVREG